MITEMKRLVDKFPNGYEGTEVMKGSEVSAEKTQVLKLTEPATVAEPILKVSDEIIDELESRRGEKLEVHRGPKLSDTSESTASKGVPEIG